LPDQSNRSTPGPDVLVLRTVFVPDGGQPPPEFINDLHPLRIPCTYNRKTGQATCRDAGLNFDGDISAEFHPDVAPDQQGGDVSANPNGSGQPGQAAADSDPLGLNSRRQPSWPIWGGSQTRQGSGQADGNAQASGQDNRAEDAATPTAGAAVTRPQPGNPGSHVQAANSATLSTTGAKPLVASNQSPPRPATAGVEPAPAAPNVTTDGSPGNAEIRMGGGEDNAYVGNDSIGDKGGGSGGQVQQAQLAPAEPVPLPLPPVFLPGTPQNEDLVNSTINAGHAIGNAIRNVVNAQMPKSPEPVTNHPNRHRPFREGG
jgi:hypothetical protein